MTTDVFHFDFIKWFPCLSHVPQHLVPQLDDSICLVLGVELDQQLDNWLAAASYTHGPARAIIAP